MRQRERGEGGRGQEERDGWTERQRQRPGERTDRAPARGAGHRRGDPLTGCEAQSWGAAETVGESLGWGEPKTTRQRDSVSQTSADARTCHRGAETWTKTNSEQGKDGKKRQGKQGGDPESERRRRGS